MEVETVNVAYVRRSEKHATVLYEENVLTVEEYAKRYYEDKGHQVLFCESVPFHVLFGVYMWLVVQDLQDPMNSPIMFGNRDPNIQKTEELVMTMLPKDFGTKGYYMRRQDFINEHLKSIAQANDLLWLFDYWLDYSSNFRQYLWAHLEKDIQRARRIVEIMSSEHIIKCLRHLIEYYWSHYLGWPDLLVSNDSEYFFVEVKSSKDKLTDDQKYWIQKNASTLGFNFRILKLHKTRIISL